MKKFILTFVMTLLLGSTALAATAHIQAAYQDTDGNINIKCNIKDSSGNETITLMANEWQDETYTQDIIYVTQEKISLDEYGSFEYIFTPAAWADSENKVYILRVGGTNIKVPDSIIIAFNNGSVYSASDINNDGIVDDKDASILLKYVSGIYTALTSVQLQAGDMDKNTIIDITDVIAILNNKAE